MSETRKLAAILVADVVGYSRLAGADEDSTLARLRDLRGAIIDPTIRRPQRARHRRSVCHTRRRDRARSRAGFPQLPGQQFAPMIAAPTRLAAGCGSWPLTIALNW